MTIEELSKLSDEELRVRCGRAHGYMMVRVEGGPVDGRLLTRLVKPDGDTELQFWWDERDLDSVWPKTWQYMPNYPADLNAMHEAEACFDAGDITSGDHPRYAYARHLYGIVPDDGQPFRATARQRCIAFIATMQQ
jgi:hypothetical protein